MKKLFRTLAVAIIALTAVFACAFAAGCQEKEKGYTPSDYNFTIVYEDDTPVNGQTASTTDGKVWIQICMLGEGGMCVDLNWGANERYADEKGRISLSQSFINNCFMSETDVTQFMFHVHNVKGCVSDESLEVNGKGDYKLVIHAAA